MPSKKYAARKNSNLRGLLCRTVKWTDAGSYLRLIARSYGSLKIRREGARLQRKRLSV